MRRVLARQLDKVKTLEAQVFHIKGRSFSSRLSQKAVALPNKCNLEIHPEVQIALDEGRPICALESTLIAHGMPYPHNMELIQRIHKHFEKVCVVPATIAVRNGVCRVGLSDDELLDLAKAAQDPERTVLKCTTRQLPLVLAQQQMKLNQWNQSLHVNQKGLPVSPANDDPNECALWGATTVASTMHLAHAAGIQTFCTGGIGGVHRHAEVSMDISADLMELARTPVIVVSAGIKSILDIPRTLEVLETYGVPVCVFQAAEFPAFFSPHSGVSSPSVVDTAEEVARAYDHSRSLGMSCGMLVAVPNHDPAGAHVEDAIQEALADAYEKGITGPAVTPFVLSQVADRTSGDSLRSNMALVERNAAVGADIAIELAKRVRKLSVMSSSTSVVEISSSHAKNTPTGPCPFADQPLTSRVIVVGGAVVDVVAKPALGQTLVMGTSNPGHCRESDGGVGRNIAEALARLGSKPMLYSAVGIDRYGEGVLSRLESSGVDGVFHTIQQVPGKSTAIFVAILNEHGDLHTACADMDILQCVQGPSRSVLREADIVVLDANPPLSTIKTIAREAYEENALVFWEPTSAPKARNMALDDDFLSYLTYASPNLQELVAITTNKSVLATAFDNPVTLAQTLVPQMLARMHPGEAHVLVTLGDKGVLRASRDNTGAQDIELFPVSANTQMIDVQNSTGAGDSFSGAMIHAILRKESLEDAIVFGMQAASLSLRCRDHAVAPQLSELVRQV